MATMGAVPGPLLSLALVLAIDSPAMQVQSIGASSEKDWGRINQYRYEKLFNIIHPRKM
jgi:hypothetical protein